MSPTRARITVEYWTEDMAYAIETIWVGEDPEPNSDAGRALAKAVEMHTARLRPADEA